MANMLGSCQKVLISTFFMLWHDVVKFVNLLLQPLRDCCANLICTFFLHIFTKNLVNSNEYFYYFSSLDWEVKNMFSKHVSVMEKESFLWKMTVIPTEYFRIMDRIPDRGTGTDLLIQVINWLIKIHNSSKISNMRIILHREYNKFLFSIFSKYIHSTYLIIVCQKF